ncbi:MAG: NAD-dependent DNA ligase LigA, partial [Bacteroidales bacterium]|nr:NAD-dependent DNA ligase LigA [Bacteroidales bacterium]
NRKLVERLTAAGLQMQQEEKGAESGAPQVLAGLRIVISGTFEKHSREEYKALIERCGGKNHSSISSQTSFILAGEGMGPSKRVKAEKLGIEILSEADFLERYGL